MRAERVPGEPQPPAISPVRQSADTRKVTLAAHVPIPEAADGARDRGQRCPECNYNLTGLAVPRCPECGTEFTWEEVTPPPPLIPFERAAGLWKLPAFVWTVVIVLFTPWIFARDVVRRSHAGQATLFLALAAVSTLVALGIDPAYRVYAVWLIVVVLYVVAQPLLLAALDPDFWHGHMLRAFRFWWIATCYTSAVLATEVLGPPLVLFSDLRRVLHLSAFVDRDFYSVPQMYAWSTESLLGWVQMILWLAALGCCTYARWRRRHYRVRIALPLACATVVLALILYGVAVEFIGGPLVLSWAV